jgi:hypothetical protein
LENHVANPISKELKFPATVSDIAFTDFLKALRKIK